MSRQFLVFAELIETSSKNLQNVPLVVSGVADKPTEWEYHSAYYYQLAAQFLKEKSSSLELSLSMSEHNNDTAESVVSSLYIGQFARLLEQNETLPLSDEDYVRYTLAEGKRFQDSFEIIALFKKSFDSYNNSKALRMASYCGSQLGKEYISINDFANAKQTFDSIASLYRQEGWVTLLREVLGYLRECSKNLNSVKDFVEYSLEMAAIPDYGPTFRETIHNEVFKVVKGESENSNNLIVNNENPLYLEIDVVSPLRVVFLTAVAFHEQTVKPGNPTMVTLSLLSQLPINVEIDQLEIQFNQSEVNFVVLNGQKLQSSLIDNLPSNRRVETASELQLITNKWLRLTYEITSEQSGKLECMYVIARIGPHFTICSSAESPASMNDLPLWKFENRVETIPIKNLGLAYSGQKAIQVEEPDPQVDLTLGCSGPALVGESFIVPVTVLSKGHEVHSGEMKINLVDTRGGGLLSPRDVEPFSTENLHVELIGVTHEFNKIEPDNIEKIQSSFGLISVPFLTEGGKWSCKLEIKWNRPKPVMLYVSLGYFPNEKSQKVHVHKSLLIEGKIALNIDHRFMFPFRRDPLLLSKTKAAPNPDSDQTPSLPLRETSILIASAKNCSEVPLKLLSMDIEVDDSNKCGIKQKSYDITEIPNLGPGEEFKKVFTVFPEVNVSNLTIGTLSLKWKRDNDNSYDGSQLETKSFVLTKYRLPSVNVELPPILVTIECPPHAILGHPFLYLIKIHNQTANLQEIKYTLADSISFVLSGFHEDTVSVLPKSEHVVTYKLVPLACGSHQLPRVSLTSVRYTAGFQPSVAASTIFVFPTKSRFNGSEMMIESIIAK